MNASGVGETLASINKVVRTLLEVSCVLVLLVMPCIVTRKNAMVSNIEQVTGVFPVNNPANNKNSSKSARGICNISNVFYTNLQTLMSACWARTIAVTGMVARILKAVTDAPVKQGIIWALTSILVKVSKNVVPFVIHIHINIRKLLNNTKASLLRT